jgi:hypothetical protein
MLVSMGDQSDVVRCSLSDVRPDRDAAAAAAQCYCCSVPSAACVPNSLGHTPSKGGASPVLVLYNAADQEVRGLKQKYLSQAVRSLFALTLS